MQTIFGVVAQRPVEGVIFVTYVKGLTSGTRIASSAITFGKLFEVVAVQTSIKVAVASKEGHAISQHFVHAFEYWIYDVSPTRCRLLEKRSVEQYCHMGQVWGSAMSKILHTIKDCDAVFVARIGESATDKLRACGVEPVSCYAFEAIEPSLRDYLSKLAPLGQTA